MTSNMPVKINLRIGLLLDSMFIQAWKIRALDALTCLEAVEISAVVLVQSSSQKLDSQPGLLFRLFSRVDHRLFLRGSCAEELQPLTILSESIPVIRTTYEALSKSDEQRLLDEHLDILVELGENFQAIHFQSLAKFGVWSFRFGSHAQKAGKFNAFYEVLNHPAPTSVELLMFSALVPNGFALYRTCCSTHMFSPARARNKLFWLASSFLARQVAHLQHVGEETFLAQHFQGGSTGPQKKWCHFPTNRQAMAGSLTFFTRVVREVLFRLWHRDHWTLALNRQNEPSFKFKADHRLLPPKGCFWADPFIVQNNGQSYIFIEEFDYHQNKGRLSVLELDSQQSPTASHPVLEKAYHLSYPCVFSVDGAYFMVPESSTNKSIDLYECIEFPYRWQFKMTLMENVSAVDSTLFFFNNRWWLFTGIREHPAIFPDVELHLFFAETLLTTRWYSHPLNPIVGDMTNARPAGQIFHHNGKLYRPSQNCQKHYGSSININEICCLTETDYKEKKVASIQPDWEPGIEGTHTYNHTGGLTVVDVFTRRSKIFR